MKYYFKLQLTRLSRWFIQKGVYPIVGAMVLSMVFVVLSESLFHKTELAKWCYAIIALSTLFGLGEKRRIHQLNMVFSKPEYLQIRFCENGLISLPFLVILLYHQEYAIALGLLVSAIGLVFVKSNYSWNFALPTPFKRLPFESIAGFRKTAILIPVIYFVLFKAIQVDNSNLALATLVLQLFVVMSFYSYSEKIYFVWIFKVNSPSFLKSKIRDASLSATFMSAPIAIISYIFFPEKLMFIVALLAIGLLLLAAIILGKYSAYPKTMGLPQAILLGLCLWFPPMLVIIVPLFYRQAKRNLQPILS